MKHEMTQHMTPRMTPLHPIDTGRRTFLTGSGAAGVTAALAGVGAMVSVSSAWGQEGPPPSEAKAPPLPAVGTVLKVPAITLLDGTVFKPEQVRGQVLVLYWWASTCPFCALQSPEMHKLWASHQAKGLNMLALSVDRKPADATAYLQKRGYSFPAAWVTPAFEAALRKPKGLPITLVVGRDGKVLQAEKGQMFPEDVAELTQWLT